MQTNLPLILNQTGVSLTSIAAMSKVPGLTSATARKWCHGKEMSPRTFRTLSANSLYHWGSLKARQHPRSTELWKVMDLPAKKPHLAHVLVHVCDVPEHFILKACGIAPRTLERWMKVRKKLFVTDKENLSTIYRHTLYYLEDRNDPRSIILERTWKRKD